MMCQNRYWIVVCCLLLVRSALGGTVGTKEKVAALSNNNFSFKQISYEQGLPGINMRCQIQDHLGIIWFSIESVGVSRYDGHKFTLYSNNPNDTTSISSNYVNCIVEDPNGEIWLATDYGLNKYSKNTNSFTVFLKDASNSRSLPGNICNTLFIDSKNNLWVGTENGLALKSPNENCFKCFFSYSDTVHSSTRTSVLCIYEQENGILWLGTNNGLVKFDPVSGKYTMWQKIGKNTNEPIHNRILSIVEDKNGYLWLGTHRGLDRFNLKTEMFDRWKYNDDDQLDLEQEGINSLLIDRKGMIWVGTYTRGIVIIDINSGEYVRITKETRSNYPIRSDHIRYVFEDNVGLIWIGTKFEGVFLYDENVNIFNNWPSRYKIFLPLKNKFILSFYEDKNDVYWVGTKHEGLFRVDVKKNKIKQYRHYISQPNSLSSNRIHTFLRDSQNNLWIGTDSGLDLFNEKNNTFQICSEKSISTLREDRQGTIWVGTASGVYFLDKRDKQLKRFNLGVFPEFFRNENIEIMRSYEDFRGNIWFATRYTGLFFYNPQTKNYGHYLENENNKQGLKSNLVRALFEDSSGRFWIGLKAGGLCLFDRDNGNFKYYTERNGLPGDMVLNIVEDQRHNLWLGTNKGLSKFNPQLETFENYNSDYGLLSNIVEIGASRSFKTGELLFGGNAGFNIFNPEEISKNQLVPPMIITSVRVFDNEIIRDINANTQIELSYNQNYISFEFTLTDYKNPYRHQYAVQLQGVDPGWQNIGYRNYVSYTNLSPGEYFFQVKGANEFGNWTKKPLTIKIVISPPLYKSAWFKVLMVLLIICLGFLIYFQVRRRQSSLERLIRERTSKLENAYGELLEKNRMINQQKKEIELHQSQLELKVKERTLDLEIAKRRAEESDKLKSSFLANMSHEIRTPLNAITGFSTLICNDVYGPEKKSKYVGIIRANTASLLKLVEDILDISKIEAGQLTIEKSFFNFNIMMSEIYTIFTEELKSKKKEKIELIFSQPENSLRNFLFYSDHIRIRQILVNLLSNAIKFTHRGKIEFGYKCQQQSILFWVKDTGIGIEESALDSIFDRFFKIEEDNAVYRGTGIGLSISKSMVCLLGGKIWVTSKIHEGSCFYFEIPGEIKSVENEGNPNRVIKTDKIDLTGRSIMIVEDERSNYELLHSFLVGTGASVSWATNGLQAVDMCKQKDVDLILLDIRMPEIDGYETLKRIRMIRYNVPVIAQTAFASDEDKRRINECGFSDLLIKPFMREELYSKIAEFVTPQS